MHGLWEPAVKILVVPTPALPETREGVCFVASIVRNQSVLQIHSLVSGKDCDLEKMMSNFRKDQLHF